MHFVDLRPFLPMIWCAWTQSWQVCEAWKAVLLRFQYEFKNGVASDWMKIKVGATAFAWELLGRPPSLLHQSGENIQSNLLLILVDSYILSVQARKCISEGLEIGRGVELCIPARSTVPSSFLAASNL